AAGDGSDRRRGGRGDTPLSSTASVGDSAPSETPPTGSSPQEEAEPEAGDGVRRRGAERSMVVRLKFLNDTERMAQVQPHDTIGYIKRYGLSTNQRLEAGLSIANHPLGGAAQQTLARCITHNSSLHTSHPARHENTVMRNNGEKEVQAHFSQNQPPRINPLLVLMLSVLWYCQIQYRQFFTAPATASLVGITIFLSLVAFGVYRR
uniref:Transmembrane and ubiquitin-like domain containing 1 n=1 Tax=Poecilia formosa TaxID=48698 RepID=A0A087XY35_POEFO